MASRQRINNKSIQEKYKIWVFVAEAYVYIVHFRPYQGAKEEKQVASSTEWRLGENVLRLVECSTPIFSFGMLMDDYFTSFHLLTHLGVNNIRATVALSKSRLCKCTSIGSKQLQKKEQGHFKQSTSSKKAVKLWLEQQQGGLHSFF